MAVLRRKLGAGRKPTKKPFSREAARIGARIREARESQGYRLTDVEEQLGISHQAISNIENGLTNPNDARARRTIQRLADLYGDDFGLPWVALKTNLTRDVRIEGRVAAGRPIESLEGDETISVDPNFINLAGDICALRVWGESMLADHICDGDVLICRRTAEPRRHAIVVVDLKGQRGAAVKRWERKGDDITLCSDFDDQKAERQPFKAYAVGKVFEIIGLIRRI